MERIKTIFTIIFLFINSVTTIHLATNPVDGGIPAKFDKFIRFINLFLFISFKCILLFSSFFISLKIWVVAIIYRIRNLINKLFLIDEHIIIQPMLNKDEIPRISRNLILLTCSTVLTKIAVIDITTTVFFFMYLMMYIASIFCRVINRNNSFHLLFLMTNKYQECKGTLPSFITKDTEATNIVIVFVLMPIDVIKIEVNKMAEATD